MVRWSPRWQPLMVIALLGSCATAPPASGPDPRPANAPAGTEPPASQLPGPRAAIQPVQPARWRQASRPGEAKASTGPAELAVDGDRATEWNPRAFATAAQPEWLALPLASPARGRLALLWHGHGQHYLNYGYGKPRGYTVEVSSDSGDGADGTWRVVEAVKDNPTRSRLAVFDAPGARWVRLRFTDTWSVFEREPFLREVAVYEADGPGSADAWLLLGDSITSVAFEPAQPDRFAEFVASAEKGRRPILIGGGVGGDEASNAVARLAVAMPTLPAGSVIGLCYGANDATRGVPVEAYRQSLQAAIEAIRAAGHQPMVAVVPWTRNGNMAAYAQACREVAAANGLPPGPDFFSYFQAHPDELDVDKVHPNATGIVAMHRLWAEAARFRYAPRTPLPGGGEGRP